MFKFVLHMQKNIPNLITLLNLLCGCVAIAFAFFGQPIISAYAIALAAVFDFFDGLVARALKVSSPIGKELDSLADVISFGMAPGAIIYILIIYSTSIDQAYLAWLAFIIPAFSALRLAKFNIDTRQSDSFLGLPTPANALMFASFPLILQENSFMAAAVNNAYFLIAIAIISSLLLLSEIPLFSFKIKRFSWADNQIRFVFLLLAIGLFAVLKFSAVPLIILSYIVLSLLEKIIVKKG